MYIRVIQFFNGTSVISTSHFLPFVSLSGCSISDGKNLIELDEVRKIDWNLILSVFCSVYLRRCFFTLTDFFTVNLFKKVIAELSLRNILKIQKQ